MDLKEAGNLLYIVGETRAELGGSLYYRLQSSLAGPRCGRCPPRCPTPSKTMRALHRAIRAGLVRACHDCSEGGLAVAAAEMALAGRLGLDLRLAGLPRSRRTSTGTMSRSFPRAAAASWSRSRPRTQQAFEASWQASRSHAWAG